MDCDEQLHELCVIPVLACQERGVLLQKQGNCVGLLGIESVHPEEKWPDALQRGLENFVGKSFEIQTLLKMDTISLPGFQKNPQFALFVLCTPTEKNFLEDLPEDSFWLSALEDLSSLSFGHPLFKTVTETVLEKHVSLLKTSLS